MPIYTRKTLLYAAIGTVFLNVVYIIKSNAFDERSKYFKLIESEYIYNINDIGVGYLNADHYIDRWALTHSSLGWVSLGSLRGYNKNVVHEIEWYNDKTVPALEESVELIPKLKEARVYIDNSDFVFEYSGKNSRGFRGILEFPWPHYEVHETGGSVYSVKKCKTFDVCNALHYKLLDGGKLRLTLLPSPSDGFPVRFIFQKDIELEDIQMGSKAYSPKTRDFIYRTRDRHSLALRRDDKNEPVIFVARGGARGQLAAVDPNARDEIFRWRNGSVVDFMNDRLNKNYCPGRQSIWLDINGDGIHDLYIVCGRGASENDLLRTKNNLLYLSESKNEFREGAKELGLDFSQVGIVRFLPKTRNTSENDVLWASESSISLYTRIKDRYQESWTIPSTSKGSNKVSIIDVDGDGFLEAMIYSSAGNQLITIEKKSAKHINLPSLGLPEKSSDGGFADFDGDGDLDFLSIPDGIYLNSGGQFIKTNWVELSWLRDSADVRIAIFDADNNNSPDVWITAKNTERLPRLYRSIYNRAPDILRNWAEENYGKGVLRDNYWLSKLYINKHQSNFQKLVFHNTPSCQKYLVSPLRLSFQSKEEKYSKELLVWPGMGEQSRFSQSYYDIDFAIPHGYEWRIRDDQVKPCFKQAHIKN